MYLRRFFLAAAVTASLCSASFGTVYFENNGDNAGWPNYPQRPQDNGTIGKVTSPTFSSSTSIHFTQTWDPNYAGRYHTEVDNQGTQFLNDSRYYGFALYLPSSWVFVNDKVCFTQWAGDGPWLIAEVRGSTINVLPHVTNIVSMGSISKGVWTRFVFHLTTSTNGNFEGWVNGVKKMSLTGDFTAPATNSNVRWSGGLYVTGWYPQLSSPPSPTFREDYETHYRVASSYNEANPDGWSGFNFSGHYKIVDRNSGKSIVVQGASTANSAPCILYTFNGSGNDEWTFTKLSDGHYEIVNVHSGLAMVVQGASTAAGAPVIQYAFGGSNTNDEWDIHDLGTGYMQITNVMSGLTLDVAGAGTTNGTIIDQAASSGAANQQFQIISVP